jgi:DNA (cytosine-5)-methyltransferase 1
MTAPADLCLKPTIRMATVCSGIGAPEVASIGLGFTHKFMAEIEPFPSAVLAHHWPEVPNLGDITKIDGEAWCGQVDVLVGGTPCQAFSVAGKRESLDDARGNLTLKFVELCDAINPPYVVWENVPGVLSTADNAFGCFLGALSGNDGELFPAGDGWSNAGCVIGPRRKLAWRILDAQYFGLAQRRRRVFVVACPRDGADPCEILFEREGVQRHVAPHREKNISPLDWWRGKNRCLNCVDAQYGRKWGSNQWYARGHVIVDGDMPRRATELEIERVFGFPDEYTKIPKMERYDRYKALGNSMAVPVMRWILKRIKAVARGE